MRKFIAVGLTTLSAGAMVLGVAPAASAAPVIPVVCAGLPASLVNSAAAQSVAGLALSTAHNAVNSTRGEVDSAIDAWTSAIAAHLDALDAGDPTGATQTAMDAALSIVGNKVSAWGQARVDRFVAQGNYDIATLVNDINGNLQSELCV